MGPRRDVRHRAGPHRRRHHDRAASPRSCAGTRRTTASRKVSEASTATSPRRATSRVPTSSVAVLDHLVTRSLLWSRTRIQLHEATFGAVGPQTLRGRRDHAAGARTAHNPNTFPCTIEWRNTVRKYLRPRGDRRPRADDEQLRSRVDRGRRQGQHLRRHEGHDRRGDADEDLAALDQGRRRDEGPAGGGRLQGQPPVRQRRHPDPGHPGQRHGHQEEPGAGRRLDRRHRPRRRAEAGQGGRHPGHRLRPSAAQHRRGRLLHDVRQPQGRRAAGAVARQGPPGQRQGRPVERRAVRRLPRRQQRDVLLQRRDEGPAADDRLRARSRSPRARPTSRPSPRCAGTPASPRSAWRTC